MKVLAMSLLINQRSGGKLWVFALLFGSFCSLHAVQQYAMVGTLARGGQVEIGVTYNVPVNENTIVNLGNYSLSAGVLQDLRWVPETDAIVLIATNLPAAANSITIRNIEREDGSILPLLTLSFTPPTMQWAAIGTQELGFTADAVGVGTNGFNLVSGGIELWDLYDETTFVYQQVSGNFDVRVRVVGQDPSSHWARAGLMVRERLDENKPRPTNPSNPSQAFSRYIDLHVNPVTQADGTPANNSHEVNIRYYTGGIGRPAFNEPTENPDLSNNAAPAYPNAWLRIRRAGQSFTVYRGSDGTEWTEMGTFAFPSEDADGNSIPPLPATLYVGPHYSPENGNITSDPSLRRAFAAEFRDYSIEASAAPATLLIEKVGPEVEISWSEAGILQSSPTIPAANWTDLPAAASPYPIVPGAAAMFYRLKQ